MRVSPVGGMSIGVCWFGVGSWVCGNGGVTLRVLRLAAS